jgi:septum formation protein
MQNCWNTIIKHPIKLIFYTLFRKFMRLSYSADRNTLPLILASSSPARKTQLKKLQISFDTFSPNIDETAFRDENPQALALRLAIAKARAVEFHFPAAVIIGADQVIHCGETRLDKPGTVENAVKQLTLVSGKSIISYTGLCVLNTQTGQIQSGLTRSEVTFRVLTQEVIEDYIRQDNPLQCAGSIKAEGRGITLFTAFKGQDPTALVGLPLILLTDFLLAEKILT